MTLPPRSIPKLLLAIAIEETTFPEIPIVRNMTCITLMPNRSISIPPRMRVKIAGMLYNVKIMLNWRFSIEKYSRRGVCMAWRAPLKNF